MPNTAGIALTNLGAMMDPSNVANALNTIQMIQARQRKVEAYKAGVLDFNRRMETDKNFAQFANKMKTYHPMAMHDPEEFTKFSTGIESAMGNDQMIGELEKTGKLPDYVATSMRKTNMENPMRVTDDLFNYTTSLASEARKIEEHKALRDEERKYQEGMYKTHAQDTEDRQRRMFEFEKNYGSGNYTNAAQWLQQNRDIPDEYIFGKFVNDMAAGKLNRDDFAAFVKLRTDQRAEEDQAFQRAKALGAGGPEKPDAKWAEDQKREIGIIADNAKNFWGQLESIYGVKDDAALQVKLQDPKFVEHLAKMYKLDEMKTMSSATALANMISMSKGMHENKAGAAVGNQAEKESEFRKVVEEPMQFFTVPSESSSKNVVADFLPNAFDRVGIKLIPGEKESTKFFIFNPDPTVSAASAHIVKDKDGRGVLAFNMTGMGNDNGLYSLAPSGNGSFTVNKYDEKTGELRPQEDKLLLPKMIIKTGQMGDAPQNFLESLGEQIRDVSNRKGQYDLANKASAALFGLKGSVKKGAKPIDVQNAEAEATGRMFSLMYELMRRSGEEAPARQTRSEANLNIH